MPHSIGESGQKSGRHICEGPQTSEFGSEVQFSISSTDCLSKLRDVLNEAVEIPMGERAEWLMRNVDDQEERQAIAALLLAYDGDGFMELDAE